MTQQLAASLDNQPEYIARRQKIFDEILLKYNKEIAAKEKKPIIITLKDKAQVSAKAFETTPLHIAEKVGKKLIDSLIIAKVNGELWDLERPFESDAALELLTWDNDEAKAVFWHSSAHVLGEALELCFGGCLCYGPPIENGFYYDISIHETHVNSDHFDAINSASKKIIKENQKFERLLMSKADLLRMFDYNEFKKRIINERIAEEYTTVYRCGSLIDLCRGPHVIHTGKVKSFKTLKVSSAYWEGNKEAESLQRVYGVSFPEKAFMVSHLKLLEEIAKRDHRKIGVDQELFIFNDLSPGSAFFLPHGTRIYNKLVDLMRSEYRKRNFHEVVTPNVYNIKLWETSGHWQNYKENMFSFQDNDKNTFAMKPMNCPGHCLMFSSRIRSYRELPLRLADFGALHRNELSGALNGLTRVRRFQQDDAHIFCTNDQIRTEINNSLKFLDAVYGIFEFSYSLKLSTRPRNYLGELSLWDRAEAQLKESLDEFGHDWTVDEGDGAFYGPKIDITLKDALGRPHQCGTIQLDFQLPINFDLHYVPSTPESDSKPVIIHRAILGSVERMIAILAESFAGKWPFWLSPRQIMIVPVGPPSFDYAHKVQAFFHDKGFYVDVDTSANTLSKKTRNATVSAYNFIFVVGTQEEEQRTIAIRTREGNQLGIYSWDVLAAHLDSLSQSFSSVNDQAVQS